MTDFKDMTKVDFSEQMREAADRGDSAEVNRLIVGYLPAVEETYKEEEAELKEWLEDHEEWAGVKHADAAEGSELVDDHFALARHMDVDYSDYGKDIADITQEALDATYTWGGEVVRLKDHSEIKLDKETCDFILENTSSLSSGIEIEGKSREDFALDLVAQLGPKPNLAAEYAAKLKDEQEKETKESAVINTKLEELFGY